MGTEVIIKTNVPRRMRELARGYRNVCLDSLAKSMDDIRNRAANQYIVPRVATRERRPYQLRKIQASHPTKLTERTGALRKMLLERHSWVKTARSRLALGGAVSSRVKVSSKGSKVEEEYDAFIHLNVTNPRAFSSSDSAQQLIMRFKHDTPGIRGKRRRFYSIAAETSGVALEGIISRKLKEMGVS